MVRFIKLFCFVLCNLFGVFSFGQSEDNDQDYLFQVNEIFEISLLNELIKVNDNFDSIVFNLGKRKYVIDSNWLSLNYCTEFKIKLHHKTKHVRIIKTEYVRALFSYDSAGTLDKINFKYTGKVRNPFYEGTTVSVEFEYIDNKLSICKEFFFYATSPNIYEVKYY